MNNIKLTIAYDGTKYLGWQKSNAGPSIEETLEKVLIHILRHSIKLQAASRTDRGVHADLQVVNFFTDKAIDLDKLQGSLNRLLPKDIVVKKVEFGSFDFHPSLDCKVKEYHYNVCTGRFQPPEFRHYMWHYPCTLNLNLMREAALCFKGKLDFKALSNAKNCETYPCHIREVTSINIIELNECCVRVEISGTNFLYKMVRNIVGSLVYVASGKVTIHDLKKTIESKERNPNLVTAPALGLKLYKVTY